jgi:hypothetical protein
MSRNLRKTPDLNGARSIAPREMPAHYAEQCSALRRLAGFSEVSYGNRRVGLHETQNHFHG